MLFNTYEFIFVFLPAVIALYYYIARASTLAASAVLLIASLVFYSTLALEHLWLLGVSIVVNYLIGQQLTKTHSRTLLTLGIGGNVLGIALFKYYSFIASLLGYHVTPLTHAIPVGISFYTFTQIAFLVDAYQRKVSDLNPIRYALFVTYFPHLIAGPVLHHKPMLTQFNTSINYRGDPTNVALGICFFVCGLFKKCAIAR